MGREKQMLVHVLLFVLCNGFWSAYGSLDGDLTALLAFRAALADPSGSLSSWKRADPSPCLTWKGVTCAGGRVTRVVLEEMGLSAGPTAVSLLAQLDGLRVLSLKSNAMSGPIPDLSPLSDLKLLFLSHNQFSGTIPASISNLGRLYRLDLSYNNLSGEVPVASLNRLERLLTLRLDSNQLNGSISALELPTLQDLNVSSNHLAGAIPASLATFPASAFAPNSALCSAPLQPCIDAAVSNSTHSDGANSSTAASASASTPSVVVASSSSEKPEVASTPKHDGKMSRAAVLAIVAGDFAVLVLVALLLFFYFWRKFVSARARRSSRLREGEKIVYSSSPYGAPAAGVFERGTMVFLNNGGVAGSGNKRFKLEDLLRASAEMLGKGGYGTAYKAVLDDGSIVAVKRLRDVQVTTKREFENHMEAIGRLTHPNLVTLNAYYYARDEKLLVFEYMPNGSLFHLLHGNRGPGRTPLDWNTRLRIAAGASRGLAHIHRASRSPKLVHGNVKSTNILLDKAGNARLSDYGLAQLGPSCFAVVRSSGYRAPEAPSDPRRPWATQKGDIYAFGIVLLELLTGRMADDDDAGGGAGIELPKWVQSVVREEWTAEVFDLELMRYKGIEEEMVGMLQIALACASTAPDQRPKIGNIVKMIDDIRASGNGGEVSSPSHDSLGSASDSPSVSEDASAAGTTNLPGAANRVQ